jgi:hypothetical protein
VRLRLLEAIVHLAAVLRDAAGMDAAVGGFGGLDAAMVGAAVVFLRLWRGFGRRLLMMLRRGLLMLRRSLLMLRWGLLMLAALLRSAVVVTLMRVLRVEGSSCSEKQEQGSRGDGQFLLHWCLLI